MPPDTHRVPLRELLQEIIDTHADPDNPEYNGCDVDPCMWCVSAKSHLEDLPE